MTELENNGKAKEDIRRAGLLKELHSITCAVFMTNLVSEYCLEITVLTSEGFSYQWIGYDEWTVYKLRPCAEDLWPILRTKIKDGTLTLPDLSGTQLAALINATIEENDISDYSELLSGLLSIPQQGGNELYCYYDSNKCTYTFAADQTELKKILANIYVANSSWDDMDTEELEGWIIKYHEEGQEIPCLDFEEE